MDWLWASSENLLSELYADEAGQLALVRSPDVREVRPPQPELDRCEARRGRDVRRAEAIHPFGDGNGRVGRLLVALSLHARGLLPQPLLYLSAYFERTREGYYDGLMRVSTDERWNDWIEYFLTGVSEQAREATELADQLLDLQARYRSELTAEGVSTNVLRLIDDLFMNPLVDAKRARQLLDVSAPTARSVIRRLEAHGALTEITGRRWGTLYRADEIDRLLRGEA